MNMNIEIKTYYLVIDYLCDKTSGPGPHPASCLRLWWLNAGFSMRGTGTQHFVDQDHYWNWNTTTVSVVQIDMSSYYQHATDGNGYQEDCFGILSIDDISGTLWNCLSIRQKLCIMVHAYVCSVIVHIWSAIILQYKIVIFIVDLFVTCLSRPKNDWKY